MNQRNEVPQSRPPDRAAVERLIEEIDILEDDTECNCDRCESHRPIVAMLRNLLQRLELAEQEKAEAVAQRDALIHRIEKGE